METQKMDLLYQKIAEQINEMIPAEWERVILYAEILDDSSEVFFYFNTPHSEDFIYSHNIPEHFHVSEEIYEGLLFDLHDLFEELRNEFKENNQHIWTNLTLNLAISGEFSIDYNYEDAIQSPYTISERQTIWTYKNAGKYPKSEPLKSFLEQYLSSQN